MPLKEGSDDETIRENALEMIRAGHPEDQAWAAAYRKAGRKRRDKSHYQRLRSALLTRFASPRPQSAMDVIARAPELRRGMMEGVPQGQRAKVERAMSGSPGSLGFAGLHRTMAGLAGPENRGARTDLIQSAFRRHGIALPEEFLADRTRSTPSLPVAQAIERWGMHHLSTGRGHVLDNLPPEAHAAVRFGLATVNSMDELRHQLQQGPDASGTAWYTKDVHDLDRGLIRMYAGRKDRDGSYVSDFGRIDRDGMVVHRTPHLKLFKALLAALSPGMTPANNLSQALRAYEIAKRNQQRTGAQSPFMVLPEHAAVPLTGTHAVDSDHANHGPFDPDAHGMKPYKSFKKYLREGGRRGPAFMSLSMKPEGYLSATRTLRRVLAHFGGDEHRAADWLLNEHPFSSPDPAEPGLLEAIGGRGGRAKGASKSVGALMGGLDEGTGGVPVAQSHHLGGLVLGPKVGRFFANLNGSTPEHSHLLGLVTKDMWFTRSWRRILGELTGMQKPSPQAMKNWVRQAAAARREGRPVPPKPTPEMGINETPSAEERPLMDRMVHAVSDHFGLTPSEFQAAWWYYEQGLWRAFNARAESKSYGPAVKDHLRAQGIDIDRALGRIPYEQRLLEAHQAAQGMRPTRTVAHFARSPHDALVSTFGGLRRDAADLVAQGRMPKPADWLHVLGNALQLHLAGREADRANGVEATTDPEQEAMAAEREARTAHLPPPLQAAFAGDNPQGPQQFARPTPGRPGQLGAALDIARSRQSLAVAHAVSAALTRLGNLPHKVSRAVLNTRGGSLPAAVASIYTPLADPQVLAAAGWHGLMSQVPGALAFRSLPGGPDRLHRVNFHGSAADLARRLASAGAYTHTLIPTKTGYTALVYDRGARMGPRLQAAGLDVASAEGHGTPLGGRGELRAGARAPELGY